MWFRSVGGSLHLGSFKGGRDCRKTQTDTPFTLQENSWWRQVLHLPLLTSYHKPPSFGHKKKKLKTCNCKVVKIATRLASLKGCVWGLCCPCSFEVYNCLSSLFSYFFHTYLQFKVKRCSLIAPV